MSLRDSPASDDRCFIPTGHLDMPFNVDEVIYRHLSICLRLGYAKLESDTTISETGEANTVSKSNVALIVVDVQNDFVDPKGGLYVQDAPSVVPNINARIAAAQSDGSLVVYTQDWHPAVTPHFAKDGGIWPVHCVGGEWGAKLYPELDVAPDAIFIKKGVGGEDGYSGFTVRDPQTASEADTELESALRARGITSVEVVGIATDYCVKETAIDACKRGFKTTAYGDCMKGVDLAPGDSDAAIEAMIEAGVDFRSD